MKAGLAFGNMIVHDGAQTLALCRTAELAGFDSIWAGEHVVMPDIIDSAYPYTASGEMPAEVDTPFPDPLVWLSFVAAAAPSLRLGTAMLIVPQRNPLVLAKELATLDQLSGGRVELGIGVGWSKEEFEALGIPWERRGARTDEYMDVMRKLWSGPQVEYHGGFVDFKPVTCSPRPVNGYIPVVVGGESDAALNRAIRIADGYFSGDSNTERMSAVLERLRRKAEEQGRDPASIRISAMFGQHMKNPEAGIEQMKKLGVDRIMVSSYFFSGPDGLDRLQEFGEKLMPLAND